MTTTLLLVMCAGWAQSAGAAVPQPFEGTGQVSASFQQEVRELRLSKPIEGRLSAGHSDFYGISLLAGQYVEVVVLPRGINVVARLYGAEGERLTEVGTSNRGEGPLPISWIAETAGTYRLEVHSTQNNASAGMYEIRMQALREATAQDGHRARAEKSIAEGLTLRDQATTESLQKALEKFLTALSEWRGIGDRRQEAVTLHNIAEIYESLGDGPKALEYYNHVLAVVRETGDGEAEAIVLNNLGFFYDSAGQKHKALDYYERALPIFRRQGDKGGEATALNNIGGAYSSLGEAKRAIVYYSQSLPILRQLGDQGGVAKALNDIGLAYYDLRQREKSLGFLDQALRIWQQVGGLGGEGTTLRNIGAVHRDLGKREQAVGYYERALKTFRRARDQAGEASTLSDIADLYSSLEQREKALEYHKQTLVISQQLDDRRLEATTLNSIGEIYYTLGDKQKALDYYSQALVIRRFSGDHTGEATTLSNIGLVFDDLGEKLKALEYYNQALPIRRLVHDRVGEAITLTNLGGVYSDIGEKQEALDSIYQALPIFQQEGTGSQEAAALDEIGGFYADLGEKERALRYYYRALPILQRVGDRRGEAAILDNIGTIYNSLEDRQKALDYHSRALRIRRLEGDRRGEGITLNNLGIVYDHLGEREKALECYNAALLIKRQTEDRAGEAAALSNIGKVYDFLGDKAKALECLEQALPLLRQVGDRNGEATALANIAWVHDGAGRLDEARTAVENALSIFESLRTKVGNQHLRASYGASVQSVYGHYVELLMQMHRRNPAGRFDSEALDVSERRRARTLLDLLTESNGLSGRGVDATLVGQERSIGLLLDAKAARLTRLFSGDRTEEQVASAKREVEALTEQYEQIEAQIRETRSRYADLTQPQPLSLGQIQRLLDRDTVLLEYSLGSERSYLWVVTQESYTSYELPNATEIEGTAAKFYGALRSPGPVRKARRPKSRAVPVYTTASGGAVQNLARKLSAILLEPAAPLFGDKRLVVVPDGALLYLPFAALADPAVKEKWQPLVLRHEIVSLPSASVLAIQRHDLDGRKTAPKTAIVVADPVFSAEDTRVKSSASIRSSTQSGAQGPMANAQAASPTKKTGKPSVAGAKTTYRRTTSDHRVPLFQLALMRAIRDSRLHGTGGDLPALPGTLIEGKQIVALCAPGESKLIAGFAANRAAVESAELSQYKYVHFATHGLLDSQTPELSALVLSLVDEKGKQQDGYLRAHEIFNLNVAAEVVILSACQTGLGKEVRGEGLVGLTQAFMYAGAKRVVMSLWNVNDASTAALMTSFYRGILKEGKRPAEALRAAQIEMLTNPSMNQWRSPYYWAPFIIEGDWR